MQPDTSFSALAEQFGPIGGLLFAAALLIGWIISGLTLVWPQRPPWAAWALSLVLGPVVVAGLALAQGLVYAVPVPMPQLVAQVIIIGIGAGLIAAGQQATAVSAERKRANLPPSADDQLSYVAGLSERLARLERDRAQQPPAHQALAAALADVSAAEAVPASGSSTRRTTESLS